MSLRSARWAIKAGLILALGICPLGLAQSVAAPWRARLSHPRFIATDAASFVIDLPRVSAPSDGELKKQTGNLNKQTEELKKAVATGSKAMKRVKQYEDLLSSLQNFFKLLHEKLWRLLLMEREALWRLIFLLVVVVAAAWRLLVSWKRDEISGRMAFCLLAGMLGLQILIIQILPGFSIGEFAILLAVPVMVCIAAIAFYRLGHQPPSPPRSEWKELMRGIRERTAAERRGRGPRGRA